MIWFHAFICLNFFFERAFIFEKINQKCIMALKVRYVDEMYASCGPQYMPDSHTYINVAESSAVSLLKDREKEQTERDRNKN